MFETKNQKVAHPYLFIKRMVRSIFFGLLIIILSLFLGMWGYHHYENMSWIDAYVNATMILSGMGPVSPLVTTGGKIFAGTYALFSGILFLVVIAVIFSPVYHRFMHQFHLDETTK